MKKPPDWSIDPLSDVLEYYFIEASDDFNPGFYVDNDDVVWFLINQQCFVSIPCSDTWDLKECYCGMIRWRGSMFCLFYVMGRIDNPKDERNY